MTDTTTEAEPIDWRHLRPETDWAAVSPADKLAIVEAMGFSPSQSNHTRDCPRTMGRGFVCCCIQPPPRFTPPRDVLAFMGESMDDRAARARAEPDEFDRGD